MCLVLGELASTVCSEVAESIDDLFMAYETLHENDESANDQNTVAVGVFYFEEQDDVMREKW